MSCGCYISEPSITHYAHPRTHRTHSQTPHCLVMHTHSQCLRTDAVERRHQYVPVWFYAYRILFCANLTQLQGFSVSSMQG